MSNKEIKDQLQKGSVKFTVEGITNYCKGNDGEWVVEIFEASEIKFKDVKLLTELINLLKYSKNENQ